MYEDSIFRKLTSEYYAFTSAEKKVADFVASHALEAQTMSISELAEECGVAEATISRFCRRLKYDGYASFKLAIATSAAARSTSNPLSGAVTEADSVSDLANKAAQASIEAVMETQTLIKPLDIKRAGDILERARTVLCMGQGGSMLLAQEAAHLFSTAFTGFQSVWDAHRQVIAVSQLEPQDAILCFSYSGSTQEILDIMTLAKKKGVPTILITRYPKSPGAAQADIVLQCGSTEGPLQLGSIPARVAQMYLIDVLFSEICHRDLEGVKLHRANVAEALAERHM